MLKKEINSLQNPYIKHLVKLRENRRYREEKRTALISGAKLVTEMALHVKTLIVSELQEPPFEADQIIFVTPEILKKITGISQPDSYAAEIHIPEQKWSSCNYLLVLDGVSDPGNLGTLIRTGLSLGWEAVFLTPNSADPFNDKAIRAAKGASFKLPIHQGSYEELKELLAKYEVFIADLDGKPFTQVRTTKPVALILGNESHGIHSQLKSIGQVLTIPISGMESLNVAAAGAILMNHLRKANG